MNKRTILVTLAMGLGGTLVLGAGGSPPDLVEAAKGDPGKPGGTDQEEPDFGDLIVLARDANGVPIPSPTVAVPDPETGATVEGGMCWQPVAAVDFSYEGWDEPADRVVSPLESTAATDGSGWLIPVDQYTCGIEPYFATYAQEVDFGRVNEARSPDAVFESQLADVLVSLATADSTSLDPAGRMVASSCGTDEATITGTIDSPLQNLAIYRQLMLTGSIGVSIPREADVMTTAARGVGAASDKTGAITVDMIVYMNQLMGLDRLPTWLPKLTQTYREEVQGVMQTVTKQFLDYGAFGYDRTTNFAALPSPAYIPAAAPAAGTFEYLAPVSGSDPPLFEIVQGSIVGAVFTGEDATAGNVAGFARAADDTRAVIDFMHSWPIPDEAVYATAVPCYADPDLITYDVSISDVSGLQVPTQMVDGSEGREFVVTVANNGPDPASGVVTVTATSQNGVLVIGSPWAFTFTEMAAGTSQSWSQLFTTYLGERTTIDWTAEVVAEFDADPGNNVVTATTSIKVTGGGGGGGKR